MPSPPASAGARMRSQIFTRVPRRITPALLYGFEAGGDGVASGTGRRDVSAGTPRVCMASRTYVLQNSDLTDACVTFDSPGLDYPGSGPEHAWLARDRAGRLDLPVTDSEAMDALLPAARYRGHHPGDRKRPCTRRHFAPAAPSRTGCRGVGESVGPRRQRMPTPRRVFNSAFSPHRRGELYDGHASDIRADQAARDARPLQGRGPVLCSSVTCLHASPRRTGGIARCLTALVEGGVDAIEVGLPYSDPVRKAGSSPRARTRRCSGFPGSTTTRSAQRCQGGGCHRGAHCGDDVLESGRAIRRRADSPAISQLLADAG